MTDKNRSSEEWLLSRKPRYPYLIQAPVSVHPECVSEKVYGEHVSAVIHRGVRTYAFQTEAHRDLFKKDFEL